MNEYLTARGWTPAHYPESQWIDPFAPESGHRIEGAYAIQRWRSLHCIRSMAEYWRWCGRQRDAA